MGVASWLSPCFQSSHCNDTNKYSFWSIVRISSVERGESLIISNQEPRVEYCGTLAGRICSWPYKEYGPSLQNSASTSYVISFAIFQPTTQMSKFYYSNLEIWAIAPEVRRTRSLACHVSRSVANNHFHFLPVTQTKYCKKYRWSLQTFFLWRHEEKNLYCDTMICVLCH